MRGGSGGGGFYSNGANDVFRTITYGGGEFSWANGLAGGQSLSCGNAPGGFGGGGAGCWGGDGGQIAGGGGSFNAGTNQSAIAGVGHGNGSLRIELVPEINGAGFAAIAFLLGAFGLWFYSGGASGRTERGAAAV